MLCKDTTNKLVKQEKIYPLGIILKVEESFVDEDGISFRYPANKQICNPISIKILVDRNAKFEVIKCQ